MHDLSIAAPQISRLLRSLLNATRLEVDFTIEHHPGARPHLTIDFTGPDAACLIASNAELLRAIEHVAAQVIHLQPDDHDRLSCDAGYYKRTRTQALQASAQRAATRVHQSGLPFNFPPMSSYERRQLHLVLNGMGLRTASTGEGVDRRLTVYPPDRCECAQHPGT